MRLNLQLAKANVVFLHINKHVCWSCMGTESSHFITLRNILEDSANADITSENTLLQLITGGTLNLHDAISAAITSSRKGFSQRSANVAPSQTNDFRLFRKPWRLHTRASGLISLFLVRQSTFTRSEENALVKPEGSLLEVLTVAEKSETQITFPKCRAARIVGGVWQNTQRGWADAYCLLKLVFSGPCLLNHSPDHWDKWDALWASHNPLQIQLPAISGAI